MLSAGVGFAAHFTIFNEEYPNYEQEDVLATVKSHRTRLSPPVRALYDSLAESSTDPDFEVFDEDIDTESDEQSLRDLEIQAYETLLSLLVAVKIDLVDK